MGWSSGKKLEAITQGYSCIPASRMVSGIPEQAGWWSAWEPHPRPQDFLSNRLYVSKSLNPLHHPGEPFTEILHGLTEDCWMDMLT